MRAPKNRFLRVSPSHGHPDRQQRLVFVVLLCAKIQHWLGASNTDPRCCKQDPVFGSRGCDRMCDSVTFLIIRLSRRICYEYPEALM